MTTIIESISNIIKARMSAWHNMQRHDTTTRKCAKGLGIQPNSQACNEGFMGNSSFSTCVCVCEATHSTPQWQLEPWQLEVEVAVLMGRTVQLNATEKSATEHGK